MGSDGVPPEWGKREGRQGRLSGESVSAGHVVDFVFSLLQMCTCVDVEGQQVLFATDTSPHYR